MSATESFERSSEQMKISAGHRMPITTEEIIKYPDAVPVSDIFAEGVPLLTKGVPFKELFSSIPAEQLIEKLKNAGVKQFEVLISQELAWDVLMDQLIKLDPSITVVDENVKAKALCLLNEIHENIMKDGDSIFPKDSLYQHAGELARAVSEAAQIGLSLIRTDEGNYTVAHSLNVALLCGYISSRMARTGSIPEYMVEKSVLAGLLFDMGNALVPKEIANKTEKLSAEEFRSVQEHVLASVELCERAKILDEDVLDGIRSHHERYDGSGYLNGLAGEQIPFIARLIAVADTFDAMTSRRAFRGAVSSKASSSVIISANETLYDPEICKVFLAGTGIYPPGTMVELSNGVYGMVVAVTEGNLLQPKVAVSEGLNHRIVNLTQERLFIRRSLDAQAADNPFDK